MKTHIVDNFVFLLVDKNTAKKIFLFDLFDLFVLHQDDSESLIESLDDIQGADRIGIEVGHLTIK
jgi:hypothetical protein